MSIRLPEEKNDLVSTRKGFRVQTIMLVLVFVIVFLYNGFQAAAVNQTFRLYTNNIRYDNKNPAKGEPVWAEREPLITQSILNHTRHEPSVVCLQEVLHNQLEDILDSLNKDSSWLYFGVGRKDGKKAGEYAPILYRDDDWELQKNQTYWLSPTPEKPSRGWDAALERIATEVYLKNKKSGVVVKVLNTHFDHQGVQARRESVKLIMSKLRQGKEPSFLCGDFNTQPKDEPYKILSTSGYKDARVQGKGDNTGTFTGFDHSHEANTIIDYIWADQNSEWKEYSVLPNWFGEYMSDHRPVTALYDI